MSEASWVTYARPFARRRLIYKRKMQKAESAIADPFAYLAVERHEFAAEAITHMWHDFRMHIEEQTEPF